MLFIQQTIAEIFDECDVNGLRECNIKQWLDDVGRGGGGVG